MKKKLGVVALVVLVAMVGLRVGLGMYASAKWRAYLVGWQNEVKTERERAASVRRPMIHGLAPIDSNVAPRYLDIFDVKATSADSAVIASALRSGARPPEIEPVLEALRDSLAGLRELARYTRCDWETPWETALTAPLPRVIAARNLCHLLIIEGRGLPPAEAAARDLDVLRVGADFETGGTLLHKALGLALMNAGYEALGATIVRAAPGELDLDALAKDLSRLAADRPGVGDALRGERLAVRSYLDPAKESELDPAGGRIVLELGVIEVDALERELEAGLLLPPAERAAAFDKVEKSAEETWNPLVRIGIPNVRAIVDKIDELNGVERAVMTAVRVEKARAADGTYPEKLDDLPIDPATQAPLVYKRATDGKGWTLSCKKLTLSRK